MKATALHAFIIAAFAASAALDRLCVFGCNEYRDLKKAIADQEAKQATK